MECGVFRILWNTGFRLVGLSFKSSCMQGSFGEEVPQGIGVLG